MEEKSFIENNTFFFKKEQKASLFPLVANTSKESHIGYVFFLSKPMNEFHVTTPSCIQKNFDLELIHVRKKSQISVMISHKQLRIF